MGKEIFRQQEKHIEAAPPFEVRKTLVNKGIPGELIWGWYAIPTKRRKIERVGRAELARNQVDAVEILRPFFGNPVLFRTLRIMDLLNGCGHQCDTCVADAVVPSNIFSYESLNRLWSMPEFIAMLQPDSFRYGSSGDLLDHPQGPEIARLTLEATADFPEFVYRYPRRTVVKPHGVKVMTNYRPNLEAQLDKLLQLCLEYPERFNLTISIPLNLTDEISRRFDAYIAARADIFGQGYWFGEDGLNHYVMSNGIENVSFMDIRHPRLLFMIGRTINEEQLEKKVERYDWVEGDRALGYRNRGLVKTYLNADGLWLMIYGTMMETHTTRIFTPLTPENVKYFSYLPYHHDFPTPPNWPGGSGKEKDHLEGERMKKRASGQIKELTVS